MAASTEDARLVGGYLMAPRVPEGLAAVVEGLTREVLRHRPEDIYVFAARHFEKLLQLRERYDYAGNQRTGGGLDRESKALRELNERLKARRREQRVRPSERDEAARSGWSLNETAKVLEKYRSIYGDEGAKITVEEVRALAREKENLAFEKSSTRSRSRSRSKEYSRNARRRQEFSSAPRIENSKVVSANPMPNLPGSTGMLAKDIKNELRRNKRNGTERGGRSSERSGTKDESGYHERTSKRTPARRPLERAAKRTDNGLLESSARKKSSGASGMDRLLKDYATQKAHSPNYVEKVQEVIDRTAPIIRDKVAELKDAARSKRRRSINSPDESTFEVEARVNESTNAADTLEARLSATRNLLEDVSSASSKKERPLSSSESTLPAVRPPSSKNSKDVSRNDLNDLVLPPISPESLKSAKRQDELVLPVLSRPGSTASANDTDAPENSDGTAEKIVGECARIEATSNRSDEEEVCRDSLNVTPDIAETPQRPDSLEPQNYAEGANGGEERDTQEFITGKDEKIVANDIADKLREVEETERRIEGILVDVSRDEEKGSVLAKLEELRDAEERLEETLVHESSKKMAVDANQEDPAPNEENADKTERESVNKENEVEIISEPPDVLQESEMAICKATSEEDGDSECPEEETKDVTKTTNDSFVLSEGSPCEIPESVTTVIIPERTIQSPESDMLEVEVEENGEIRTTLTPVEKDKPAEDAMELKSAIEAFGEYVKPETVETSTVDIDFIRGIKAGHDVMLARQDLEHIQEEDDKEFEESIGHAIERSKVKEIDKPVLQDISENVDGENLNAENVKITEESNGSEVAMDETQESNAPAVGTVGAVDTEDLVENSLEAEESTEVRSTESTNEAKETSASDQSTVSLSTDPARPVVPELNLDSLQDITVSSFKMSDEESKRGSEETRRSASLSEQFTFDENKPLTDQDSIETSFKEPLVFEVVEKKKSIEGDLPTMRTPTEGDPDKGDKKEVEENFVEKQDEIITSPSENIAVEETVEQVVRDDVEKGITEEIIEKKSVEEEKKDEVEVSGSVESTGGQGRTLTEESEEMSDKTESKNGNGEHRESRDSQKLTETEQDGRFVEEIPQELIASHLPDVTHAQESNGQDLPGHQNSQEKTSDEPEIQRKEEGPAGDSEKPTSCLEEINDNDNSNCEVEAIAREMNGRVKILTKELSNGSEVEFSGEARRNSDGTESKGNSVDREIFEELVKGLDEMTDSMDGRMDDLKESKVDEDLSIPPSASENLDLANQHADNVDTVKEETQNADKVEEEKIASLEETTSSCDIKSTSPNDVSSLNSAATKIQAGVRGFLTRQHLRASEASPPALNALSSVQGEDDPSVELSARQRLRRESALQSVTSSLEKRPFAENGLQHTGEFHDCLPLPALEPTKSSDSTTESCDTNNVAVAVAEDTESGLFADETDAPVLRFQIHPNVDHFLDLLAIAKDEEPSSLQDTYLNFITSVEDAENVKLEPQDEIKAAHSNDTTVGEISIREPLALPGTPDGLVIQELTSLDDETSGAIQLSQANNEKAVDDATDEAISKEEIPSNHASSASSPDDEREFLESSPISLDEPISRASSAKGKNFSEKEEQRSEKDSSLEKTAPTTNQDVIVETTKDESIPPDVSLSTLSFSANADDVLGLCAEGEKSTTNGHLEKPKEPTQMEDDNTRKEDGEETSPKEMKFVHGNNDRSTSDAETSHKEDSETPTPKKEEC